MIKDFTNGFNEKKSFTPNQANSQMEETISNNENILHDPLENCCNQNFNNLDEKLSLPPMNSFIEELTNKNQYIEKISKIEDVNNDEKSQNQKSRNTNVVLEKGKSNHKTPSNNNK